MRVLTVSQVTRYIKELLDSELPLQDLWLEGEVSNYRRSPAGHVYFTLKDETAQMRCVMWRSVAEQQSYLPNHGEAVLAHGHVSVYEAQGAYQFYVDLLQPAGLGPLHAAFEALKAKLQQEGLFAPERKRPLPPFPAVIGVVTSPQAAALRDILRTLRQRYPLAEVILAPTLVQGAEAPAQIVAALDALNARKDVDVVILARGGGSLEELWAFNDENVARAVAASRAPVVVGVGHETDFTMADFAADVRAPTPTAAATTAVPDRRELLANVRRLRGRLGSLTTRRLSDERRHLTYQVGALSRYSPQQQIANYRQRVDDLLGAALMHLNHRLRVERERLRGHSLQLQSLNPAATLARGYAIVRHEETGQVVTRVRQVRSGDPIDVQVSDGEFGATVGRQGRLGI